MASIAQAYADNTGELHHTPTEAALADLGMVLGRVGNDGGLTLGIAKLLLEKREEIEQVYADLDKMALAARPSTPVLAV